MYFPAPHSQPLHSSASDDRAHIFLVLLSKLAYSICSLNVCGPHKQTLLKGFLQHLGAVQLTQKSFNFFEETVLSKYTSSFKTQMDHYML